MRQKRIAATFLLILVVLVVLFLTMQTTFSYPMTSTNYIIRSGALTAGQNLTSSGGNYKLDFSFHEPTTGSMTVDDNFVGLGLTYMLNTEPNASFVDLIPDSPKTNETLNCTFIIEEREPYTNLTVNITFWRDSTTYGQYVTYADPINLTGYTITTGVQQEGESWLCTVEAYDGLVYGNSTNSSAEVVANAAPEAQNVHITSDDYPNNYTTGNLTGHWTFYDLDSGDTNQSTEMIWYKDGTQEPTAQDQNYLTYYNTSRGEVWTFSVRVNDGTQWSNWRNATITIQDTPPSAPAIVDLQPAGAVYTNTTVTCAASGSGDDDGDAIAYYYKFNNTGFSQQWSQTSTFDCNTPGCEKGDTLYCWAKAVTATLNSSLNSDSETVLNTRPEANNVSVISSDQPNNYTTSTLIGNWNFTDIDETDTNQSTEMIWYRDGSQETTAQDQQHLASSNTSKGETWTFSVRVSDGTDWSWWRNSTITIENKPPVAANVRIISSDYPENYTISNLIGHWNFTDDDGDTNQSTEIIWYKDGTQEPTAQNQQLLNASNTSSGEVWTFSVRVNDGTDWSAWANATITIHSTNPEVINIITYNSDLTQTSYFLPGELIVARTNVSDADGADDIASATIMFVDSASATRLDNASMTNIATIASDNIKTYEYNYTLPSSPSGTWTIYVYAFDSGGRIGMNLTTFWLAGYHTIEVKLAMNNTYSSVYIPGTGETNASLLGAGTVYRTMSDWYLASYHSNLMSGLVAATAIMLNISNQSATHTLEMQQNLTGSMMYLALTKDDWRAINNRIAMIESGDFMLEIAPSFSFGLGLYYPIKMLLNYTDIDVQGDLIMTKGLHKIEIESTRTDSQEAVYIREVSE